jgi:hypothetical protein
MRYLLMVFILPLCAACTSTQQVAGKGDPCDFQDPFENVNPLQKFAVGLGGVDAVEQMRANAFNRQLAECQLKTGKKLDVEPIKYVPSPPKPELPKVSGDNGTKVYDASQCTGAIVNGECHGTIINPGAHKTCHGEWLNGQCTGPLF